MTTPDKPPQPWSEEEIERERRWYNIQISHGPARARGLRWLATLDQVSAELQKARAERDDYRQRKDAAYTERNRLVAALSRLYPAHLARHPEDPSWEPDWYTIVCIHSPVGQLTWHIHDSQRGLFDHLGRGKNHWDGHSTDEKYDRLSRLTQPTEPGAAADPSVPPPEWRWRRSLRILARCECPLCPKGRPRGVETLCFACRERGCTRERGIPSSEVREVGAEMSRDGRVGDEPPTDKTGGAVAASRGGDGLDATNC